MGVILLDTFRGVNIKKIVLFLYKASLCEKYYSYGWRSANEYKEITLYRDLSPIITFKANGGKVNGAKTATISYRNYTFMNQFPTPKRKGFKFLGWYQSTKGYTSEKANGNEYVKDLLFGDKRNMTLYAHWSKKIKIKLNPTGGKLKKKKRTIKRVYKSFTSYYTTGDKSTYGKLPQLGKKKGKYFKGWYTKKKGGKRIYTTDIIKKAKNHTIYAQWY